MQRCRHDQSTSEQTVSLRATRMKSCHMTYMLACTCLGLRPPPPYGIGLTIWKHFPLIYQIQIKELKWGRVNCTVPVHVQSQVQCRNLTLFCCAFCVWSAVATAEQGQDSYALYRHVRCSCIYVLHYCIRLVGEPTCGTQSKLCPWSSRPLCTPCIAQ